MALIEDTRLGALYAFLLELSAALDEHLTTLVIDDIDTRAAYGLAQLLGTITTVGAGNKHSTVDDILADLSWALSCNRSAKDVMASKTMNPRPSARTISKTTDEAKAVGTVATPEPSQRLTTPSSAIQPRRTTDWWFLLNHPFKWRYERLQQANRELDPYGYRRGY